MLHLSLFWLLSICLNNFSPTTALISSLFICDYVQHFVCVCVTFSFSFFQRITVERDELLDRLQTADDSNAHLQRTLDELRVATKSQREEIRILDEATAQAASKVNAKNELQSMLRDKAAELKVANNGLKEKVGEAGLDHGKALAELKKLQSQVVQSPERVRREMHESQRALQQERREGEAAEAASLVASNAAKITTDAVSKVNEAAEAVSEIMDLSNKCVEVSQQVKAREAAIASFRKDAAEVKKKSASVGKNCFHNKNNNNQNRTADLLLIRFAEPCLSGTWTDIYI